MPITYSQTHKAFRLTTRNTLYLFKICNGVPVHLYYGKKRGACVPEGFEVPKINMSFSPYYEKNGDMFSFDTQNLEYSYFGSGDFRATSLRIRNSHGDSVTHFEYVSHNLLRGRVDIPSIPAGRADENTQTLDLKLVDKVTSCELHLYYTVFPDCDIITRYACVTNQGKQDIVIEKFMSACLDLPGKDYEVLTLSGSHVHERSGIERTPVFDGNLSISSRRGASSHQMSPFMAVCQKGTGENRGQVYGLNFVWSGSFLAECEGNQTGTTRVQMGLGTENFTYRLTPEETVWAPEVMLTYSPAGLGTMSRNFHSFINHHIVPEKAKQRRPVLLNSWEAFYFDIDEKIMVDFAAAAADCNMDMVVMDDGWFGSRTNDRAGLGDWYHNPSRFQEGLAPFIDRVKATGVKFGIWIEPEMVNPDSELYRTHPDWVIGCPNRKASLSRNQLVLDLSNPEVRDYLKDSFRKTFGGLPIDYFKWDMNRHISEPASFYLAVADQGSLEYRYMLGVYDLFDWFTREFPDAMIENCSGGGGRYDPAMMYYSTQIWTSDNTSASERTYIQYGSQLVYPASVMSCHVADPHGDLDALDAKFKVAIQGILGYEFNVLKTPEPVKAAIRRQVEQYRSFDHVIQNGIHYRLVSPYESEYSAWYYDLDGEFLLSIVHTDGRRIQGKKKKATKLAIPQADKNALYRDTLSGETYTGQQLRSGIEIGSDFVLDWEGFGGKVWHFVRHKN